MKGHTISVKIMHASFMLAAFCVSGPLCLGQASGTITGRVFNPAMREYVRNAEVRLRGSPEIVFTESDGSFRIANVAAGDATLSVFFSGYSPVHDSFTVAAGQTVIREINITSTASTGSHEVVTLGTFTVSSEREGNAKAVMNQRRQMDITTSVASDIFGDVMDGNVGEFVKYLPGVDLDYVNGDARGVRLGGMDGQYVGVSFDGIRTASADQNRGGGEASRAVSLETITIASIESVEISRTTSADSDADSPAGTINMKTKRAFDRKGRHLGYNAGLNFNSEEFTWKKTPGPRDREERKWRPNLSIEYSQAMLGQRLGILLNATHVGSYSENVIGTVTNNINPSPADPRPVVVTAMGFRDGPRFLSKDSILFTADLKATSQLVLSFTAVYNSYTGSDRARFFTFTAASNNSNVNNGRIRVGGDGVLNVSARRATTGNVDNVASLENTAFNQDKRTHTRTFAPKFEYKLGSWAFDGAVSISKSINRYEGLSRGFIGSEGGAIASGWTATRPSATSWEWTIRQTSGPDWFDLGSFSNTNTANGGTRVNSPDRLWKTEIWNGQVNALWRLPFRRFPVSVKIGGKWNEESRDNQNQDNWSIWSYIGPEGNTVRQDPVTGVYSNVTFGNWSKLGYMSPTPFDLGPGNGPTVFNSAGVQGMPPRVDVTRVAALFHTRPDQFVHTGTADNFYSAFIANKRDFRQTITAGYGQVDVRLSPKLQLRAGVRMEITKNEHREFNPRLRSELIAAGFATNAAGRATTSEGLQFQYFSKPRVTRESEYHDLFPSLLLKYQIGESFEIQAGFNRAISRPPIDSLTGLWVVDETNLRVTAPNPELQPEHSKNFQTRLAYYFGGHAPGQLSFGLSQNDISNLRETFDFPASEFGVAEPEFAGFTFRSSRNSLEERRFRSMDCAYNQTLGFLPDVLRGTSVNLAYTRSYASQRRNNLAPHRITSRIGYAWRRFNGSIGMVWRDASPNGNYGRYKEANRQFDLTLNWRLFPQCTLYVQGRNITNEPFLFYDTVPGHAEGRNPILQQYSIFGASWVFGVKGTF